MFGAPGFFRSLLPLVESNIAGFIHSVFVLLYSILCTSLLFLFFCLGYLCIFCFYICIHSFTNLIEKNFIKKFIYVFMCLRSIFVELYVYVLRTLLLTCMC